MRLHEPPDTGRDAAVAGLTPRAIVQQLDQYIVGQSDAKRAVAIALRNRWRRQQLAEDMRQEVLPKNIIMIGPTGVGKTEIARRLAGLANAPFVKVEASHYTEVGYHGRDVESMVRELVDLAVDMVQAEMMEEVRPQAETNAVERLLDYLYEPPTPAAEQAERAEQQSRARERLRTMLQDGKLDERTVEIQVTQKPAVQGFALGAEEMGVDMQSFLEEMLPSRTEQRRMKVAEALDVLIHQESQKLVDRQSVARRGLWRAENNGIIFIDELDKIAGASDSYGPDVSREGVQRDMLPIVEGCTVPTRYGMVRTDHILFVAAGAFNVSKPSDLVPELQGRFPIRVELDELTRQDFVRILKEPRNALTKQYRALLGTEGIDLQFADDALERIAEFAERINQTTQSIGARRLQTVMERLLETLSFDAPDEAPESFVVDRQYVDSRLADLVEDEDLTRYIL